MTIRQEEASASYAGGWKGLCSSVEMVLVVQTMSYINYELDLGGHGLGHGDVLCDTFTMTFRGPRG